MGSQGRYMGLIDKLLRRSNEPGPISASAENFDSLISSTKYAVVDFWSKYCPPCHAVEPVIKKLANEYRGSVVFLKVSVTSNPKLAERFRVRSVPAFLFFADGKLKARRVGSMNYETFKQWIENSINSER